jgi:phosphoribosylformimino-5-aminoimidazole carboxamide ribonucleotide (ProFAR) isomerase
MSNAQFTLLAGVEIAHGQVEVLNHGEADDRFSFGDPVTAAKKWIGQGAQWIHVADLDAAAGQGENKGLVEQVIRQCRGNAHVEVAGGIRDDASIEWALTAGCARAVVDTAMLSDLDWVKGAIAAHGQKVGVAITAHRHEIYAPGSGAHGLNLLAVLEELKAARCAGYIVTDVDAKGVRKKSQRHVLEAVLGTVHGHVVCCGGISYLQDLHALTELVPRGLDAVVVDRALYTEAFSFTEATAALEPRYDLYHWGPPS